MPKLNAPPKAQPVVANEVPDTDKTITLESPWGSKVTVAADQADVFKDAGFTK